MLALVIFWGTVVPAIDEAITADEITPGTVFTLGASGATVSFTPAPGWVVSGVPVPSQPKLQIYDEGVSFDISVGRFDGTPAELLDDVRDLHDELGFEGDEETFTTASGIPGAAVEIVGVGQDGGLFAMVAENPAPDGGPLGLGRPVGIEVIVEGPPQSLQRHTDEIAQMISDLTVEFPGAGS